MDEAVFNVWKELVDTFDLLRSDVLALREFEDIFSTINDLQSSGWENLTDVTGVKPAIDDCVVSLLSHFIVSRGHIVASN